MRVLYVNTDGGGFASLVEVAPGLSVEQFFAEKVPYGKPTDYLVRVNRLPVAGSEVLKEGDRITCTPLKIEGAA